MVVTYDETNSSHEALLRDLYLQVFGSTDDLPSDMKTPTWQDLGF